MADNEIVHLRKQREEEALHASYLTMNSLELAASKHADEVPARLHVAIQHALKSKAALEDQVLHIRHVSAASQCGLLQHLELYLADGAGVGVSCDERKQQAQENPFHECEAVRVPQDDQSLTSVLTGDNECHHERGADRSGLSQSQDQCTATATDKSVVNHDRDPSASASARFPHEEDESEVTSTATPLLILPPDMPSSSEQSRVSGYDWSSYSPGQSKSTANGDATLQSLALATVNDSLRLSIENAIRALVSSSPVHNSHFSAPLHEGENKALSSQSVDVASSSSGHERHRPSSSRRSVVSVDGETLDEVQRGAGELAEAITKNILCSAMLRIGQDNERGKKQEQDQEQCVPSPPAPQDTADLVAVLARAITPSIVADAILSACNSRLGTGTGAGAGAAARDSDDDDDNTNTDDVHEIANALTESITPDTMAESLSVVCSARKEDASRSSAGSQHRIEIGDDSDLFAVHQYKSSEPPIKNTGPEENDDGDANGDADGDDALMLCEAQQHSPQAEEEEETQEEEEEEVVDVPSVAVLADDPLYREVFHSTARGLRVLDSRGRQSTTGGHTHSHTQRERYGERDTCMRAYFYFYNLILILTMLVACCVVNNT
mgnify:CR=1 FL=1